MALQRSIVGIFVAIVAAVVVAVFAWWWTRPVAPPPPEPAKAIALLEVVDFDALPGWAEDDQREALPALLRSCARMMRMEDDRALGRQNLAGTVGDWRPVCEAAEALGDVDADGARRFFEAQFRTVAVRLPEGSGLFTGYYEPTLHGSLTPGGAYTVPLLKRPDDLIEVDLGAFDEDLKGKRVAGRVKGTRLVPYFDHGEILDGALDGRDLELVWVDDAVDAFFLQIQGSGVVMLDDGGEMRVGYAGQNGRSYFAIGRELLRRNAVPKEQMSMQAIRTWLNDNPDEAGDVMRLNKSFVFFRARNEDGAVGAQGAVLTPERSLAVDRKIYPMGLPIWLDTTLPDGATYRRLMMGQDTGGAIRGPVRGDVFFGAGEAAGELAGRMKQTGTWHLLLPRSVNPPAELY